MQSFPPAFLLFSLPVRVPFHPCANESLDAGAYFLSPLFSRLHDLARLSFFLSSVSLPAFLLSHLYPPPTTASSFVDPVVVVVVVVVASLHPASIPLISPFALYHWMHRDICMPFYWQRQLPSRSSLK